MGMARPVMIRRIRNDLRCVEEATGINVPEIPDTVDFPLKVDLVATGIRGYSGPGRAVTEHRFSLIFSGDYPYERPKVRWNSEIFHPNIMPPSEGGMVCVMGIDHWDFNTDLGVFVRDLTDLIKNPNPHDPLRSETCSAAAEWFLVHE